MPSGALESAGQVVELPVQVSATSHAPAEARHVVPLGTMEQVPTLPARLQEAHPPLQAVSQQTPPTQKPIEHWLFDVHDIPPVVS